MKQHLFAKPFSFKGRIRRLECGLTILIFYVYNILLNLIPADTADSGYIYTIVWLLLYIPAFIFVVAQNTKRCHDLGYSGWWQLLPFYGLLLLFVEGDEGSNEYGENPKL